LKTRFDSIIKVDVQAGKVVNSWKKEGVYVTEANFIPREDAEIGDEDAGVLVSAIYDGSSDSSSLLILDARNLEELANIPLAGDVVSFHPHGTFFDPKKKLVVVCGCDMKSSITH